jgi:hypothetical protein
MNSFHMMIEKQQNNSTTTSCNIHSPTSLLHRLLLSLANLSRIHFPQSSSSNPLGSIHVIGGFLVVDD